MTILINTDKNISGNERLESYVNSVISEELSRFSEYITRIEVHFSDENASKDGTNDKRCMIEVRLKNKQPIAVTSVESTTEKALSESLDKLKVSIEKINSKPESY